MLSRQKRTVSARVLGLVGSLLLLAICATPVLAALILGTNGPDRLIGTVRPDTIRGYAGRDNINGKQRGDYLYGNTGDDRLVGETGADHLYGGSGDDRLLPGRGEDYVSGGVGNDFIRADDNSIDTILCGDDFDTVYYDLKDFLSGPLLEDIVADDCEQRIAVGTPSPTPSPGT